MSLGDAIKSQAFCFSNSKTEEGKVKIRLRHTLSSNKQETIYKERKIEGQKVMNHHCKSAQKEKLVHKNSVG